MFRPTLRRMADHLNKAPLLEDPALIKWYEMHQNRYKHFRWTRRTAGITFAYTVIFPGVLMYIANKYDGKFDFRGKRRGDTIVEY